MKIKKNKIAIILAGRNLKEKILHGKSDFWLLCYEGAMVLKKSIVADIGKDKFRDYENDPDFYETQIEGKLNLLLRLVKPFYKEYGITKNGKVQKVLDPKKLKQYVGSAIGAVMDEEGMTGMMLKECKISRGWQDFMHKKLALAKVSFALHQRGQTLAKLPVFKKQVNTIKKALKNY